MEVSPRVVLIRARWRFRVHPSDNYRSLRTGAAATSVSVPQAMQRDEGKHSGGVDSSRRLQSARMPDGFLIDFLVLSQFFITSSSFLCQRCADLSLGLAPAKSSSDEHLCARVVEVWFMNGSHQEYSFWQKEIMEETLWSNLWPFLYH